MRKEIFNDALEVMKKILTGSVFEGKTYLVGGCVRDLVLGLDPKDIDLCIDVPNGSTEIIKYLSKNHSNITGGYVEYKRYGTSKFNLSLDSGDIVEIECVIPRTETYNEGPRKPDTVIQCDITNDAKRRDFCCNALYMDLWDRDNVLDPTGRGIQQCMLGILETPLEPRDTFLDDPLRMLRAVRFATTKGFEISFNTLVEISDIGTSGMKKLSKERIRDEFTKILMSPNAVEGIRMLHENNLLGGIILPLENGWSYDQQTKYHNLTLGEHLMAVLGNLLERNPKASLELRLAALLHDISKSREFQYKIDGSKSYHGHEISSSSDAELILEELKYPGQTIRDVQFFIENHMCIKQFAALNKESGKYEYTGKNKVTRRIIRTLGEDLESVCDLIDADNNSHAPEYCLPGQIDHFLNIVGKLRAQDIQNNALKFNVNGNLIISALNIPTELRKGIGEIKLQLQELHDENPNLGTHELLESYKMLFGDVKFYIYINKKKNKEILSLKKRSVGNGWVIIETSSLFNPILYKRLEKETELNIAKRELRARFRKLLEIMSESEVEQVALEIIKQLGSND